MPILKATFFFRQNGQGWTESLFKDVAAADLEDYWADALLLAQKRIPLSGTQTELYCLRLSYEGIFRDVLGRFITLAGDATHESDAPTTCLDVYCQNLPRTKTKYTYLRGVWDSVVKTGGTFVPTAGYTALFNSWKAEILAKNWGWMSVKDPVDQLITAVVVNADKTIGVTVAGNLFALPLPTYTQVRISGAGGCVQLNGLSVVKPLTQTTFNTKFPLAIFPWTVGGKVRWSTKELVAIKHVGVSRTGERRVGRPSYLPVGRRRARARV